MKTPANVYLISTGQRVHDTYMIDSLEYHIDKKLSLNGIQYHLYIALPQSDLQVSEVKEGNHVIDIRLMHLGKLAKVLKIRSEEKAITTEFGKVLYLDQIEKVIATTDPSSLNLKAIPKSFINHFVSEYNEKGTTKQVEVRLNEFTSNNDINLNDGYHVGLELNQQNEISIAIKKEKLYTKKEVKSLCRISFDAGQAYAQGSHEDFIQIHKNKEHFIDSLDL